MKTIQRVWNPGAVNLFFSFLYRRYSDKHRGYKMVYRWIVLIQFLGKVNSHVSEIPIALHYTVTTVLVSKDTHEGLIGQNFLLICSFG